jgi:hypothetical protein
MALNRYDTVTRTPSGELVINTVMAANSANLTLPVDPDTGEVLQGDNLRHYITVNNWDKLAPKNKVEGYIPFTASPILSYDIESGVVPRWFSAAADKLSDDVDVCPTNTTSSNTWSFSNNSVFVVSMLSPQANGFTFYTGASDVANSLPHPTDTDLVQSKSIYTCTVGSWCITPSIASSDEPYIMMNPNGTSSKLTQYQNNILPWRYKKRHKFTSTGESNDWICIMAKDNTFWNSQLVHATTGQVITNSESSNTQYMFVLTGSVSSNSGKVYNQYQFVSAKTVTAQENTSLIIIWK